MNILCSVHIFLRCKYWAKDQVISPKIPMINHVFYENPIHNGSVFGGDENEKILLSDISF
jgi:hypothetical protein